MAYKQYVSMGDLRIHFLTGRRKLLKNSFSLLFAKIAHNSKSNNFYNACMAHAFLPLPYLSLNCHLIGTLTLANAELQKGLALLDTGMLTLLNLAIWYDIMTVCALGFFILVLAWSLGMLETNGDECIKGSKILRVKFKRLSVHGDHRFCNHTLNFNM